MKKTGTAVGVVIALVLGAVFVPLVEAEFRHTETYLEDEPYEVTETYYETEPLEYRRLDSFHTEAVKDVRRRADFRGYDLPHEIVEWPDFALYFVVQNLDDVVGTFEIRYTITTANKEAAERQMHLSQRTPEEYEELEREYYAGSIELQLESSQIGVYICPPGGIYIAPDRVPFDHEHDIAPDTKEVEKERTVTRERTETHYKRITLFEYLFG